MATTVDVGTRGLGAAAVWASVPAETRPTETRARTVRKAGVDNDWRVFMFPSFSAEKELACSQNIRRRPLAKRVRTRSGECRPALGTSLLAASGSASAAAGGTGH